MKKYKIIKTTPQERYYEILLKADSNDGNYITEIQKLSQEEFDKAIDELIILRNDFSGEHELEGFESEIISKYDRDVYLNIPCHEDQVCHTLVDIIVKMYDSDGCVYNVEF